MAADPDCIFCKIVAGEIPSFNVYEDAATLAFMDINPVSDGHVLVIPKAHFADVVEVSEDAIGATSAAARKVAQAVQAALEPPGLNLLQCNGEAAAQSVQHFHMHVIPRRIDDDLSMNWPIVPGNMDAIAATAERIKTKR